MIIPLLPAPGYPVVVRRYQCHYQAGTLTLSVTVSVLVLGSWRLSGFNKSLTETYNTGYKSTSLFRLCIIIMASTKMLEDILRNLHNIGMTKRQTTANHHKPPQTTTNHRKPPQTTANHHKSPPEFGTIIRRYDGVPLKNDQTTANQCKPLPEFEIIGIHVLVKSKYLLNYNRFSN